MTAKTAEIHSKPGCPFALKAKKLLILNGYDVQEILLNTPSEINDIKTRLNVSTTPQIFLDGTHVGGYDDTHHRLTGQKPIKDNLSYRPVIALFSVAALLAIAMTWVALGTMFSAQTVAWFIALSMVLLGLQKLQDLAKFADMFSSYDLLARRWYAYGLIYPFVETGAGILMLAGAFTWLAAPPALFVATIGAISVFKAVYMDRRDLRCACVGGDSKVPLGFVSLLENVMMMGMAVWMLWGMKG